MGKLFDLFIAVYGRTPITQQEFDSFCRLYQESSTSENSRRIIK